LHIFANPIQKEDSFMLKLVKHNLPCRRTVLAAIEACETASYPGSIYAQSGDGGHSKNYTPASQAREAWLAHQLQTLRTLQGILAIIEEDSP
jgi:hypothetical protein